MNLRAYGDGSLGIALDETTTSADVEALLAVFAGERAAVPPVETLADEVETGFAAPHRREGAYLTHPVFNAHHSETRCCATSAGWSRATSRSPAR